MNKLVKIIAPVALAAAALSACSSTTPAASSKPAAHVDATAAFCAKVVSVTRSSSLSDVLTNIGNLGTSGDVYGTIDAIQNSVGNLNGYAGQIGAVSTAGVNYSASSDATALVADLRTAARLSAGVTLSNFVARAPSLATAYESIGTDASSLASDCTDVALGA